MTEKDEFVDVSKIKEMLSNENNIITVRKMVEEGMNATQIAKALGKSRNWVKEILFIHKFRKLT